MANSPSDGPESGEPTGSEELSPAVDPTPPGEAPPSTAEPAGAAAHPRRTRAGSAWVGITIAVILLVLLIVFIAQNTQKAKISFLWLDGRFPVGLALLVAAVAGALVAVIAGSTRILQLRQSARARRRAGAAPGADATARADRR